MTRNGPGKDGGIHARGDHCGLDPGCSKALPNLPLHDVISPFFSLIPLHVNSCSIISIKNIWKQIQGKCLPARQFLRQGAEGSGCHSIQERVQHAGVLMNIFQIVCPSWTLSQEERTTYMPLPQRWQVCRCVCWLVFERMLNLDVFSTSFLIPIYRWNWFLLHWLLLTNLILEYDMVEVYTIRNWEAGL